LGLNLLELQLLGLRGGHLDGMQEPSHFLICVQLSEPEMAVYQILSAISKKIFTQFLRQREQGNSDLNYYALERTPQFMEESFDTKYTEIYHRFLKSLGYNPGAKIKGIVILVLLLRLRQFCCHPGLMLGVSFLNVCSA